MLVTGGAGFIGSALIRLVNSQTDYVITNLDKLTYAGNLESTSGLIHHQRHSAEKVDICNGQRIAKVLKKYQSTCVLHLAT